MLDPGSPATTTSDVVTLQTRLDQCDSQWDWDLPHMDWIGIIK